MSTLKESALEAPRETLDLRALPPVWVRDQEGICVISVSDIRVGEHFSGRPVRDELTVREERDSISVERREVELMHREYNESLSAYRDRFKCMHETLLSRPIK